MNTNKIQDQTASAMAFLSPTLYARCTQGRIELRQGIEWETAQHRITLHPTEIARLEHWLQLVRKTPLLMGEKQ